MAWPVLFPYNNLRASSNEVYSTCYANQWKTKIDYLMTHDTTLAKDTYGTHDSVAMSVTSKVVKLPQTTNVVTLLSWIDQQAKNLCRHRPSE